MENKSGDQILQEVEHSVRQAQEDVVRGFLVKTVDGITAREAWVKARSEQIEALKILQKEIVKCYDKGELTKSALSEFESKLAKTLQEKVSANEKPRHACRVRTYEEEQY